MGTAKNAEIFTGFYRGPDTPRDQDDHHREHGGDRKFRPQLVAKRDCLKDKGSGERHRTIDQQRQTNDACEHHWCYQNSRPEE